jgi:Uma2 family endonuclease
MEASPRPYRISVETYRCMAEEGVLAPDARVELIDGTLYDIPPIESRPGAVVDLLNQLLILAVGDHAIVRCRGPVQLGDFSEPQPDLSLLAMRDDFYREKASTEASTLLAIEVSESTLRFDRTTKMALYARHRIPEFWLFDVNGRQLHCFRNPMDTAYADVSSTDAPGIIGISALPDVTVDLSGIFG